MKTFLENNNPLLQFDPTEGSNPLNHIGFRDWEIWGNEAKMILKTRKKKEENKFLWVNHKYKSYPYRHMIKIISVKWFLSNDIDYSLMQKGYDEHVFLKHTKLIEFKQYHDHKKQTIG